MAKFDSNKDQVFGTIEALVSEDGTVLQHGPTVPQPEDKSVTRYRFSIAAYNGGALRLRVQTVYTRKSDNVERVNGCSSWLLSHASGKLTDIVKSLAVQAEAQRAKIESQVRKAG